MTTLLEKFFKPRFHRFNEIQPSMAIDLATAVLMIEVSRADFSEDDVERQRIRELLLKHLSLCEEEIDALLQNAEKEADKITSLQHITRMMNEQLDLNGKIRVIELMWQVVYADGVKDAYEEHLMRQVSDLLYIPHEFYIKARWRAENSQQA
jgi:uncharacterized tellurite resistance protein B-like protein